MTCITESLKKFCNPRMTWTIWNSVLLNKSGLLVNKYQAVIVFASTNVIMNGGHQWNGLYTDLAKLIYIWLSLNNTNRDVGMEKSSNWHWFLVIKQWFQNPFGKHTGTLKIGSGKWIFEDKSIFNNFFWFMVKILE